MAVGDEADEEQRVATRIEALEAGLAERDAKLAERDAKLSELVEARMCAQDIARAAL